MKTLLAIVVLGLLLVVPLSAVRADEDNNSTAVGYLLGSGFLCSIAVPNPCPDVVKASNGDTMAISGQGTFTLEDGDITGGGTFTHSDSSGKVLASGTWTATELLSFTSFGPDPTGSLPPNLVGGLALIEVKLSPSGTHRSFEAVLQVDCGINSPTGAEGVMLTVEDRLSFTQEVSGLTVFVVGS